MRLKGSSRPAGAERSNGLVELTGWFKKYKSGKKKFFVLRDEDQDSSPRLEYYDSEKKFNTGQVPKRSIALKTCFNIARQSDPKYKNVIALYTKDGSLSFIVDSDELCATWMKKLIALQRGERDGDDAHCPPYGKLTYETYLKRQGRLELIIINRHSCTQFQFRM